MLLKSAVSLTTDTHICWFVCLHQNVSDLTAGDVTSNIGGTGNALGVCLFTVLSLVLTTGKRF